jgi:hypothetical protein
MGKSNTVIPIRFEDITKDVNKLGTFLHLMEDDIFDFEDIQARYANQTDAKVEIYKLARETYNKKLDFLIKVAELRKDISQEEAAIISFILNMSLEQKKELKKILLDLSMHKPIDIPEEVK